KPETAAARKTAPARAFAGELGNPELRPVDRSNLANLSDETLRARLGELDRRYSDLVDQVAQGEKVGSLRGQAAVENRGSARVRAQNTTPTAQLRGYAETKLQHAIDQNPEHPAVQKLRVELDEADAL